MNLKESIKLYKICCSNKIVQLCALGSIFELYEYTLFACLITKLSDIFFHKIVDGFEILGKTSLSLLAAPAWGYIGDKVNRKTLLKLSMLLMALPSAIISILPTNTNMSIVAYTLIICRVIQGISSSAEIHGARIFAIENSPYEMKRVTASILRVCSSLGTFLAMYAAYLVTNSNNPNSWRYPFALGSIAMLIVVYIRGKIKDHYKPEKLKYTKMNTEVIYSAIL